MVNRSLKRDWVLTETGLNKLLGALDQDRQRAAEQYEHLRHGLIRYFDWRGSICPERDADETIDRVARKLCEDCVIDELYSFSLGVARNVALESLRAQQKERALVEISPPAFDHKEDEDFDLRLDCCENCLLQIASDKRELILAYYEGDQGTQIVNRQKLAESLGVPISRLRIQAHRIREKLESCIRTCLASKKVGSGV